LILDNERLVNHFKDLIEMGDWCPHEWYIIATGSSADMDKGILEAVYTTYGCKICGREVTLSAKHIKLGD
jgi:hypothetical protein